MTTRRTYSRYTRDAVTVLGKLIKLRRKERGFTETDLAERAGISRATLQKIEKGTMGSAIGLVFEVATLVGIRLFDETTPTLEHHSLRLDDRLAVLPSSVRKKREPVNDDF